MMKRAHWCVRVCVAVGDLKLAFTLAESLEPAWSGQEPGHVAIFGAYIIGI
jgi:hypothetical protein